ncbi:hypothetical protein EYF80_026396 [Liparis tanakae]|uniref:Uncharacterized protein n=1 Tax=Liparis tanakae TaxID=230148 RepID=A0A4Z2HEP5_9TELE|nr:hypothetical protein EYF80_026396 [Liparis tanakae]
MNKPPFLQPTCVHRVYIRSYANEPDRDVHFINSNSTALPEFICDTRLPLGRVCRSHAGSAEDAWRRAPAALSGTSARFQSEGAGGGGEPTGLDSVNLRTTSEKRVTRGCPMSHLTTVGLISPKAVSVVIDLVAEESFFLGSHNGVSGLEHSLVQGLYQPVPANKGTVSSGRGREPGEPRTGQGQEIRQLHPVFEDGTERFSLRCGPAPVDLETTKGPLDPAVSEAGPGSWFLTPCPCFLHPASGLDLASFPMALSPSLCLLPHWRISHGTRDSPTDYTQKSAMGVPGWTDLLLYVSCGPIEYERDTLELCFSCQEQDTNRYNYVRTPLGYILPISRRKTTEDRQLWIGSVEEQRCTDSRQQLHLDHLEYVKAIQSVTEMLLLYGGRSNATIAAQLGFACRFIHSQMENNY